MAKIVSETVVITVSRIVKDNDNSVPILNEEITLSLEQVVQELAGVGVVVEVERA